MRMRILGVIAATALLAACGTSQQSTESQAGGGGTQTAGGSGTTMGGGGQSAVDQAAGPMMGSEQDFIVNVGDRVYFDFDRYNIRSDAAATLEKQAAWLKKFPAVTINIEGHCDERGTREYNLALGERRANSVKEYLSALGIASARLRTISYGKERPVCVASTESCWQQNRRGVTKVSGAGAGS